MASTNEFESTDPMVVDFIKHYRSITRWWSAVSTGLTHGDYTNYRVLVADDEVLVSELLDRSITSQLGCRVETVMSGAEAIARLEACNFEVLITDMVMPGLNGLELIRSVRDQFPDLAIIVMTGFPDNFPFVDVVRAGANDFIVKPHSPQELEAKLIRIFEERRLRDAHILAEVKYRSIFEYSMDGMALVEPGHAEIIDANRAFATLCGRLRDQLHGVSIYDLVSPTDGERMQYGLRHCESEGQSALGDLALIGADGCSRSIDASLSYVAVPGQRYILLVAKDVTEKREIEQHLADAAERDDMTGLSNKRRFRNRIEWAVARATHEQIPLTLFLMDLDNFKQCNDTYGHQTGDDVLRWLGKIIRLSVRAGIDEGFRFGGDEFAVILLGADAAVASRIAERMRSEFVAGNTYGTTISIGVAQYAASKSASELIGQADEALYAAKSSGKNAIIIT